MKFQHFSSGSIKISQFFRKGSDRDREAQETYQRWISGIQLQLNQSSWREKSV